MMGRLVFLLVVVGVMACGDDDSGDASAGAGPPSSDVADEPPDLPVHDPDATVGDGFYAVHALAGAAGPANEVDPCQGFDALIGQHVAGVDGQCYGLDLATGLGSDTVEHASVVGELVSLTFTDVGIDRFNQLAQVCADPGLQCGMGQVAVVTDGQVVSALTVQQDAYERDAISITGDLTAGQLTAIADAFAPG